MKKWAIMGVAIVAAAAFGVHFAGPAEAERLPGSNHGGRPLTADLSGENEVPPAIPQDPDAPVGTGFARVTLNPGQEEVCFQISVEDIATPTAAHIHRGAAGVNGSVVVNFQTGGSSEMSGCVSANRDLIREILKNPSGFYVNVHNADFPGGAVRGQLSK